jgi:hypothetical protein
MAGAIRSSCGRFPRTKKQRILDSLTDWHERILFGLEPPGSGRGGEQSAQSGGNLVCSLCGKTGLTERGLKLHTARIHKGEKGEGDRTSVGSAVNPEPPPLATYGRIPCSETSILGRTPVCRRFQPRQQWLTLPGSWVIPYTRVAAKRLRRSPGARAN